MNSTFFKERIQLSLKPGKRRLQTHTLKKKKEKSENQKIYSMQMGSKRKLE